MRALIVAAVSTVAQADGNHVSLDEQLRLCREVCDARGWKIVGEVVVPGHSRNYNWMDELIAASPDYASIIRQVRAGVTDLLVVRDMDRLWRTDALRAQVMAVCREHKVQVYSVNQPVEPVDPSRLEYAADSSMILEAISGVISEQENRTRTRRMMMGRRARVTHKGLTSYGPTNMPYGYRAGPDGTIEPDPLTAPVVRRIFDLRVTQRLGGRAIANVLEADGIPTKTGLPRWRTNVVLHILRNPVYAGRVEWGGLTNDNGQHEAIIDGETWRKAQIVDALKAGRSSRCGERGGYALTGLVRCGFCGGAMVYVSRSDRATPGLRCSRYVYTGGAECQSNWHKAADVERYVFEQVSEYLRRPDAWAIARQTTGDDSARQLSEIDAAVTELDRRWAQWSHAYEIGAISLDEMLVHRERIHGERDALAQKRTALADSTAHDADMQNVFAEVSALVDLLPQFPPDKLREVYNRLIAEARLKRGSDPEIDYL